MASSKGKKHTSKKVRRASKKSKRSSKAATVEIKAQKKAEIKVEDTSKMIHLVPPPPGISFEKHENKSWICPDCKRADDGSPMISYDYCDDWRYHWPCMTISMAPPEDGEWFCPTCRVVHGKRNNKQKRSAKVSTF